MEMEFSNLSDKDLRELKNGAMEELRKRNISKKRNSALGRLNKILNSDYFKYQEDKTPHEFLATMTKEEFSRWHQVGKSVIQVAEIELEKRGLRFKESLHVAAQ